MLILDDSASELIHDFGELISLGTNEFPFCSAKFLMNFRASRMIVNSASGTESVGYFIINFHLFDSFGGVFSQFEITLETSTSHKSRIFINLTFVMMCDGELCASRAIVQRHIFHISINMRAT